ncbi:hypothetical protein [Lutimonas zeaxanthinifaciens]|uniref:hypothetical protein n=1 Tax=Lutimonas zeaxanthinifaciens TaxID=3060215 RepID=UPI00265D3F24|nr:hypothetical protein [Lutimonas sp. YSD2104]WKK67508.1 hypothetical protein QZH61_07735 [Lutimonas sp. YSD2104]
MKLNYYIKLLLASLIITALYFVSNALFFSDTSLSAASIWGVLSNLLIVLLLGLYVSHSSLRGLKLVLAVFSIYYIIGHFNLLIEAYIFNVTDRAETTKEMFQGLFVVAVFSPLLVLLLNKWEGSPETLQFKKRSVFSWIWRIALGMFVYLVFYLAAGMILQASYPDLMSYYAEKLPPVEVMILTQFPRGLLFVLIAILMLRTLKLKRIQKGLLIGLVFSVIGGIAPLIPPSEFMPANIRMVHGIEVGISNFLYGMALAYLLGQEWLNKNSKEF